MIALLLSKFGAWIIGAAGGAALLAVAYLRGGSSARQKGALSAATDYKETRERIDHAALGDNPSPDALRELMRARPAGKR